MRDFKPILTSLYQGAQFHGNETMRDFKPMLSIGYNGNAMSSPFLDLLKQIADGVVIYERFPAMLKE
jgi:hypothetical protein